MLSTDTETIDESVISFTATAVFPDMIFVISSSEKYILGMNFAAEVSIRVETRRFLADTDGPLKVIVISPKRNTITKRRVSAKTIKKRDVIFPAVRRGDDDFPDITVS